MKINPIIFREYDIRGIVDKDLNEEFAYLLGRAYATLARDNQKNNIAVGYDCRLTSESYTHALTRGLADEGISSTITGMGPTPQLYYALFSKGFGGGIQVTGSHNPSDMNGFKVCLGLQTLSGEQIQDLKKRVFEVQASSPSSSQKGTVSELVVQDQYISELIKNCKPNMGPRKLKVVVDAGNGVGGLVGPAALKGLGVEVIELYTDPDGRFPNHHPDPTEMKNIKDLIAKVHETSADFGIGWDGDADRIGVVDERGEVIFGDMLLLIYARSILKEKKGATIIGDVKCSSRLFDDIKQHGGNAVMWKTGHSLIKGKLKELNGELAGEMSGHIFFKHRYYGYDDALYCSCRLAEIMSNTEQPLSGLLSDVPKMISTPEIRVDCSEEVKFKVVERAKDILSKYEVSTIDGVRVNFEHGWGLVRASNTQPVLVMRFEATNERHLGEYRQIVEDAVRKVTEEIVAS